MAKAIVVIVGEENRRTIKGIYSNKQYAWDNCISKIAKELFMVGKREQWLEASYEQLKLKLKEKGRCLIFTKEDIDKSLMMEPIIASIAIEEHIINDKE